MLALGFALVAPAPFASAQEQATDAEPSAAAPAPVAAEPAPKGEIVLLVGGPGAEEGRVAPEDLDAALREALASLSLKDAVAAVAGSTGLPRRRVYARALDLAAGGGS